MSHQGHHRTCPRSGPRESSYEVWKVWMQSIMSVKNYRINKVLWPWPIFQECKGHTKAIIEVIQDLDLGNVSVKFESNLNYP